MNADLGPEFPSRKVLIYLIVQMGVGLLFSMLDLERIQWLQILCSYLDEFFGAFGSGFNYSSTPLASKALLLLWWVGAIPVGLVFVYRFTSGYMPSVSEVKLFNGFRSFFVLVVGVGVLWMFVSLNLIGDHSYDDRLLQRSYAGRGDLVPMLMSGGCFSLSIWLAASSFVMVLSVVAVCKQFRLLVINFKGSDL